MKKWCNPLKLWCISFGTDEVAYQYSRSEFFSESDERRLYLQATDGGNRHLRFIPDASFFFYRKLLLIATLPT